MPLLKGKRTSKIRPEFVIFDPQVEGENNFLKFHYQNYFKFSDFQPHHHSSSESKSSSSSSNSTANASGGISDTTDSDKEDGCTASPRMQRKKKKKHKSANGDRNERTTAWHYRGGDMELEQDDLSYVDTLPEV